MTEGKSNVTRRNSKGEVIREFQQDYNLCVLSSVVYSRSWNPCKFHPSVTIWKWTKYLWFRSTLLCYSNTRLWAIMLRPWKKILWNLLPENLKLCVLL